MAHDKIYIPNNWDEDPAEEAGVEGEGYGNGYKIEAERAANNYRNYVEIVSSFKSAKDLPDIFKRMLEKGQFKERQDFVDAVNARIERSRSMGVLQPSFPEFTIEVVNRWADNGDIRQSDMQFKGFMEAAFGMSVRSTDAGYFYTYFVPENTITVQAVRYRAVAIKDVSDGLNSKSVKFAEIYRAYKYANKKSDEDMCFELGIFPSFEKAFEKGHLIPLGEPLIKFVRTFDLTQDHEFIRALKAIVQHDYELLRQRDGNKKFHLVRTLSACDVETRIHVVYNKLIQREPESDLYYSTKQIIAHSQFPIDRDQICNIRLCSIAAAERGAFANFSYRQSSRDIIRAFASGLTRAVAAEKEYQHLVEDFIYRKMPRKSLSEVLQNYIDGGGRDFASFFDFLAQTWGCTKKEACSSLGIHYDNIKTTRLENYSARYLYDVAERNGMSIEDAQKLVLLRFGGLDGKSLEEIISDAQQLIHVTEGRKYNDFPDNIVAQKLRTFESEVGVEFVDQHKVANALLAVLLEKYFLSIYRFYNDIGHSTSNGKMTDVLIGKQDFLVHKNKNRTQYYIEYALKVGNEFTDDPELADKIALLMLGIPKRYEPKELVELCKEEKISIGHMCRILRLQLFLKTKELEEKVSVGKSKEYVISDLETRNLSAPEGLAKNLTELFYEDYPEDSSKDIFLKLVTGVYQDKSKVIKNLEERIEAAHSNYGKNGAVKFSDIIPLVKDAIAGGEVGAITKIAGCVRTIYAHVWIKQNKMGRASQADNVAAKLTAFGLKPDFVEKFIELAMAKVKSYDENLLEGLNESSSSEQREMVIRALREQLYISQREMAKLTVCNGKDYSTAETSGYFELDVRNRATKIENMVAALVPEELYGRKIPKCAEHREKFRSILSTPPLGRDVMKKPEGDWVGTIDKKDVVSSRSARK